MINTSANTSAGVSYTLIQINASGGTVSSGYYDVNDTGNVGQAYLSGSYDRQFGNGYVKGTWNVNERGTSVRTVSELTYPGYYVDERTSAVGGGNITAQTGTVTSNAAWAGSYATKQFGYFLTNGVINSGTPARSRDKFPPTATVLWQARSTSTIPAVSSRTRRCKGLTAWGTRHPDGTRPSITTPTEGTRNYVGYIVDQGQVQLLETDNNLVSAGNATRQF